MTECYETTSNPFAFCSGFFPAMTCSDTDKSMDNGLSFSCLMCLCFEILIFRRGLCECVCAKPCVCVCVCVRLWFRNLNKVTLSFGSAAAAQIESNITFTYRHTNCSRRLLPAPPQCGFYSHVDLL